MSRFFSVLPLIFALCFGAPGLQIARAAPDFSPAAALVRAEVENGKVPGAVPGAVLLIGHQGQIALREAFGNAGLRPQTRPMSADTIFDLASLTKPVATSTAAMILLQEGRIQLDAPVAFYLPAFRRYDKANITIRNLLTHTAGFPAGGAYAGKIRALSQIVSEIAATKPKSAPGTQFLYSDFSFITLGAVVEAVSGQKLDAFCQNRIFAPLGMNHTFFRRNEAEIAPELLQRIAATTAGDDTPATRGKVHDPTSRALGGVAGHAGLFSTADDLARFCQMILGGGELDGARILRPETVKMWTAPQSPAVPGERTLGWDMNSAYSIRRELSAQSFGHTGFTGTSIWIDPASQTFIILLSNAVHAQPAASVIALRRAVSSAVAASLAADSHR